LARNDNTRITRPKAKVKEIKKAKSNDKEK
jgi:hypothetical protein